MSEDIKFTGSIPDIYDDYLVPLIFEGYARDLAERVAAEKPERVLETAAGSGVVTRELASMLSADASYFVTDLNSPMIERAKARQKPDHRISWRSADALKLPYEDDLFEAILCQFGVMFFPDRMAGFAEAQRALRPGGTFSFNVYGIGSIRTAFRVSLLKPRRSYSRKIHRYFLNAFLTGITTRTKLQLISKMPALPTTRSTLSL